VKPDRSSLLAAAAIVAFSAFASRGLPPTWLHSPYDRLGWAAFLLWLVPVVALALRGAGPAPSLRVSLAGFAGTILGVMGEVHAVKHAGLALALVAFVPAPGRWTCLVASTAWMPALGWVASHAIGEPATAAFRLALAAAGAAGAWFSPRGREA
jgi:hypothetical protein